MKRLLPIILLSLPLLLKGDDYYDYWERESIRVGEYFACSSEYLFAFDEKGDMKWKTSIGEMPGDIVVSPDFICLAWDREISIYDRKDGKLLWEKEFPEEIWATGTAEEESVLMLSIFIPGKIYLFDFQSGKLIMSMEAEESGMKITKIIKKGKEIPLEIGIEEMSSVPEITIGLSKKHIFGFLPDGKIEWKIERDSYSPEEGWDNYLELRAPKGIKVIKRSTGETVWEKRFVYPIKEYEGRTHRRTRVILETGKIYTLDLGTGEVEEEDE